MSILECNALTKYYGGVQALTNVDLTIESGRIVGLVGPNGSGKTTLIKLAQHLLTPTSGMITIDGMIPGPETKAIGFDMIAKELKRIPKEKVRTIAAQNIEDIKNSNRRDFRF